MSKLTIDECKQIILKGRKQLTSAEQRIVELESLARDMWGEFSDVMFEKDYLSACAVRMRMKELGLAGDE